MLDLAHSLNKKGEYYSFIIVVDYIFYHTCKSGALYHPCNKLDGVNNCTYPMIRYGGQVFLKAWLSCINASLAQKLWAPHDSRESHLRQPILIFIDNMITGVLFNHLTALCPPHQLSLTILCDKYALLASFKRGETEIAGDSCASMRSSLSLCGNTTGAGE